MLLKGWLKPLWNRCRSQRRVRSRVSNRRMARFHVSELIGLHSSDAGKGQLFENVETLEDRALLAMNDLTVVTPQANSVDENSSVTGNVLTGAVDADGAFSDITVTAGTFDTDHGSITIAANGDYTYTPTPGYDGADSYTFTAVAGGAGED